MAEKTFSAPIEGAEKQETIKWLLSGAALEDSLARGYSRSPPLGRDNGIGLGVVGLEDSAPPYEEGFQTDSLIPRLCAVASLGRRAAVERSRRRADSVGSGVGLGVFGDGFFAFEHGGEATAEGV